MFPGFLLLLALPLLAQSDPAAVRAASIQAAKKAIQSECDQAAGGDWQRWFDSLAPFRTTMKALVDASVDNQFVNRKNPGQRYSLLRWKDDPNQYVHTNTAITLGFFGDTRRDPLLEKDPIYWAKSTPMISTAVKMQGWLAARGIDLILVPIPIKSEIYADHLVTDQSLIPADKNVMPHMRRRLLEFLNAGVEVVDLYPLFMKARSESEPLFMAADTHWMQKPQRIAAVEIAARLKRYPWIRQAQSAPPRYAETIEKDRPTVAMFWDYLTEAEQKAIEPYRMETIKKVTAIGGGPAVVESPNSPVLIAGDSFTHYDYPYEAGIVGLLAQQLNQPVSNRQVAGALDEVFRDMFRDPSILKGKKVVIWLLNDEPVGRGDMWPANFAVPSQAVPQTKK